MKWKEFSLFPSVLRRPLMCLPMQLSSHRNFPFPLPAVETAYHLLRRTKLAYKRHIPWTSHLFMFCKGNALLSKYNSAVISWHHQDGVKDIGKMRPDGTANKAKESLRCVFFILQPQHVLLLCMERYWTAIVEITLDFWGHSLLLLWYGCCRRKWIKQMDSNNIRLNVPFRTGRGRTESSYRLRGRINERSEEKFTSMSSADTNHTICQVSVARINKKTQQQQNKHKKQ